MRVFITGASSGIGAAMAKKFDAMGAQLGLVGRSQEKLDTVLSSMQNTPPMRSTSPTAQHSLPRLGTLTAKPPWTSC